MSDNPKRLFVFGNLKGGTGKTECALTLITALDGLGVDVEYGEVDEVRRLSEVLSEKKAPLVSLKTAPEEVSGFAIEQLQELMNPLVRLVEQDVSVLDLGANIPDRFIEWAESSMLKDVADMEGTRLTFVSVTTSDGNSIYPGLKFIRQAWDLFGNDADYAIISNDISGGGNIDLRTNSVTADEIAEIEGYIKNLATINIPNCPPTKSISFARNSFISIYELLEMIEKTREKVIAGENIDVPFTRAIDLNAHPSKAEKKLYLNQQLIHVKKWIKAAHEAMIEGLDLETLKEARERAA